MNEDYIVTAFCVMDEMLKTMSYEDDVRSSISAAEVLIVAVVAAKYFRNHLERALCILIQQGEIARISLSRFNRRLHGMSVSLSALFAGGDVFVVDSMPLPVCKRIRAWRCPKVRGRAYCGYCAAKQPKFFGWRLQLICTANGLPVAFEMLPAARQDLTAIHEWAFVLPPGARLFGDKGFISAADAHSLLEQTGLRLITPSRKNMAPNPWGDDYDLQHYRKRIETIYSQMEKMGLQHLDPRTNLGFEMKVYASILALTFTNLID
jgi:Transposase DDE domain